MKNPKTTISAILTFIFAMGPVLFPKYTAVFTALAGLAVALGLAAARDGGTGSQAVDGPMEKGLQTQAAPLAIDSTNAARIIR